jgi:murein DD-endopeptidase MepM/ murein hydrolase activator NlpD
VYRTPRTLLEEQIHRRLNDDSVEDPGEELLVPGTAGSIPVRQFPGTDFVPEERQLFLQIVFDDPVPPGVISSPYGYRHHPLTGVWAFHYGIDLAADFGEPVITAAEGTVARISRDPWLGLSIEIDHAGGYTTRYAHLQETFVSAGTFVERGGTIGSVGSTGFSTGPHLHFEVIHDGDHKNPIRYLQREPN